MESYHHLSKGKWDELKFNHRKKAIRIVCNIKVNISIVERLSFPVKKKTVSLRFD